ncbi:hypothetical protein [Methylobacterium planeticum]|uniref:Uncharacterized protein n=1 Tax=Methylobacterium planeticum TaxID=2615211 RepID=A0A6N6MMC7_9HYPH|nr:hypothetical protein [Methylobacterium planeticum]KAB1072454.1 hypothetical protein F6X51_15800 [Methylobacterium planeticum]
MSDDPVQDPGDRPEGERRQDHPPADPGDAARHRTFGRLAVLLGLVLVAIAGYATLLILVE